MRSPSAPLSTPPLRLLTLAEAEGRFRTRQSWAGLWHRRVRDTSKNAARTEPAAPRHEDPEERSLSESAVVPGAVAFQRPTPGRPSTTTPERSPKKEYFVMDS